MCEAVTIAAIGTYLAGAGAAAGGTAAAGAAAGTAAAGVSGATMAALAATAAAGAVSAYGSYQQGKMASAAGRANQTMAEYAAQDATRRGEADALAARRRGDMIKGAQRGKLAASGIDLGFGTAAELQAQTDFFSQGDQDMARFNAARDAWSLRARGTQAAASGDASQAQGNLAAFGTALGTGGSVAGKWYAMTGGAGAGAFASTKRGAAGGAYDSSFFSD
jgi:hypothetical protein